MRLSFQLRQAHIITTDLTLDQVHKSLEQKFNSEEGTKKWWSLYYNYTNYMGTGDTFRIEKEVKEGKTEIDMVAIAHLFTDKSKTIINIQYAGYCTFLNIVLWAFTIISAFLAVIFTSVLFTEGIHSDAWLGFLISFVLCLIPQLIRLYYSGFISGFHSQVLFTLKNSSKMDSSKKLST